MGNPIKNFGSMETYSRFETTKITLNQDDTMLFVVQTISWKKKLRIKLWFKICMQQSYVVRLHAMAIIRLSWTKKLRIKQFKFCMQQSLISFMPSQLAGADAADHMLVQALDQFAPPVSISDYKSFWLWVKSN